MTIFNFLTLVGGLALTLYGWYFGHPMADQLPAAAVLFPFGKVLVKLSGMTIRRRQMVVGKRDYEADRRLVRSGANIGKPTCCWR